MGPAVKSLGLYQLQTAGGEVRLTFPAQVLSQPCDLWGDAFVVQVADMASTAGKSHKRADHFCTAALRLPCCDPHGAAPWPGQGQAETCHGERVW